MEIFTEAAKQVPSLCVLCFIVFTFIKFIRNERELAVTMETARLETLKTIGDTCHQHADDSMAKMKDVLSESAVAIKDNTKALGQNTEAFHRVEQVIDNLKN